MTIRSMLIALPILVLGWFLTLLLVAVLTDEAPAYVVIFPDKDFVDALPADVPVVAASNQRDTDIGPPGVCAITVQPRSPDRPSRRLAWLPAAVRVWRGRQFGFGPTNPIALASLNETQQKEGGKRKFAVPHLQSSS